MKKLLVIFLMLVAVLAVQSQTVFGKWKTIDDETGKAKSIVEIYEHNGKVYGKIIQLFREPEEIQNPICNKCSDDRKDQPIIGMVIVRDLQLKDGYYKSGTICDPKKGKVYTCEMWLDAKDKNKLQVRGYWGFIYRTQTWQRVN